MNDIDYWTATCQDCGEAFDGFYETCPDCDSAYTVWTFEELD